MTLVATEQLSRDEALVLTAKAYEAGQSFLSMVQELYVRGAHKALGYRSFAKYFDAEFRGMEVPRISAADRPDVVRQLSAAGMSTRAVAAVTGATPLTVRRDLGNSGDAQVRHYDALSDDEPLDAEIVDDDDDTPPREPTPEEWSARIYENIVHLGIDAVGKVSQIGAEAMGRPEQYPTAIAELDRIIRTALEAKESLS